MTAALIAREFKGRKCGGGYIVFCPAHKDRSRSLSVTDRGGKILVHCFAGCDQAAVIEGLRSRGLWPEREYRPWTQADRVNWARQKDEQRYAEAWGHAAGALTETVLEDLGYQPDRTAYTRLLAIVRRGGDDLIAEFRLWKTEFPDLTRAMVRAGQTSDSRTQRALANFVCQLGGDLAA